MTSYCSLADAYGSDFGMKRKKEPKLGQKVSPQKEDAVIKANENRMAKYGTAPTGQEYHCPYCQHCNSLNNKFQQNIVDQAVWPRPRWIPQQGQEQAMDPYGTRFYHPSGLPINTTTLGQDPMLNPPGMVAGRIVEHFGSPYEGTVEYFESVSQANGEKMLNVVLWLLVALFVITLINMIILCILP